MIKTALHCSVSLNLPSLQRALNMWIYATIVGRYELIYLCHSLEYEFGIH